MAPGGLVSRIVPRIVAAATVVAIMIVTGCSARGDAATTGDSAQAARVDAIGEVLSQNGIAIVPFTGGDPVYDVGGEVVYTLTDWQLEGIAAATPASLQKEGSAGYGGVSTQALADSTDELPAVDGFEDLTPDRVVFAWWIAADSERADAARELMGGRPLAFTTAIPLAVLALFVADALGDAGFDADAAGAASGAADPTADGLPTQVIALGAAGAASDPLADVDPCGVVSDAIDDVNAFLAGMGEIGAVIKSAITSAIGGLDALTGGALTMIKRAIAIANMVLNVTTLLTPWKVNLKAGPAGLQVGLNGPGQAGKTTVSLDGVVSTPPKAVQSCLALVGIVDPTSQQGSLLSWTMWNGYVANVTPSTIVEDALPQALGDDNTATATFTTGTETLDAANKVELLDQSPNMTVFIERADVASLTSYIRSLDSPEVQYVLGGTLESIATAIELAANPDGKTVIIPVTYWAPKAEEAAPPGGDSAPPANPPGPATPDTPDGCLDIATVEAITGYTIARADWGVFGEAPAVGPGSAPEACRYFTSAGGTIAIMSQVWALDETGAVGAGFEGILTPGDCDVAAGYLPAAGGVLGYYVWTGHGLKGTFFYNLDLEDKSGSLANLARAAYLCTH